MVVRQRHIDHVARKFVLHLLGCTLFMEKTRNNVLVSYLILLVDLDSVHQYVGRATLAYLY